MSEKEVMRLVTSHRDLYQMLLHITHSVLMREPDARISKRFAMENVVIPLCQIEERVTVGMADPLNQGIMSCVAKAPQGQPSAVDQYDLAPNK